MRQIKIVARKITICPTFNACLNDKFITRVSVCAVRAVGNQWRRRTPLDPDSGPRSSQMKTEPGRIQSRLSMLVSRLVIRGKILRATASKMMWLSRVFLTRTSVNVGPCIPSRVFGAIVSGEGKSEPEALLYVGVCIKAGGNCQ